MSEQLQLAPEIQQELELPLAARAVGVDDRHRRRDHREDFVLRRRFQAADRRIELSHRRPQLAQVIAELGRLRGICRDACLVRLIQAMLKDHLALLHRRLAVGPRQQRQQNDMVAELVAQPAKPIGKRRLRFRVEGRLRQFAQEGAEAADKKAESHGSSHEGEGDRSKLCANDDTSMSLEGRVGLMAGYSGTPLAQKLGIKPEMNVLAVNAPKDYRAILGALPKGVSILAKSEAGEAQLVHLFVRSLKELDDL